MRFAAVFIVSSIGLLGCADDGRPPAPYNVTAETGGGAAELRWSYKAAPGLDCFLIQRSEGFNYNFRDQAKSPAGKLYYNDDDVTVGERYYYRVAAFFTTWNDEKDVLSRFSPEVAVKIE